jgi:hypothetical protein
LAKFSSLEFVKELQERCNSSKDFNIASGWSDTNVVLAFGDERYWLKLYRGEIIDVMEYEPMTNALGYEVIVSGPVDAWKDVLEKRRVFWNTYSTGEITIEGNLIEANRMHEALMLMLADTLPEIG